MAEKSRKDGKGDWIPDVDNGGVAQQAIQAMLLQPVGDKLYLLPAWPKDWNVEFKLHAPRNTIIKGKFIEGKFTELKITPESRRDDIVTDFETDNNN